MNTCSCPPNGYDPLCPFTLRVLKAVAAYAVPEIPNDVDGVLSSPSASLGSLVPELVTPPQDARGLTDHQHQLSTSQQSAH